MNRNQKIALGCGGAGCLGLIVVVIAAWAYLFLLSPIDSTNRDYILQRHHESKLPT